MGDNLVRAAIVNGRGDRLVARDLSIYDRSGGVLQRVIHAVRAIPRMQTRDWLLVADDEHVLLDIAQHARRHTTQLRELLATETVRADRQEIVLPGDVQKMASTSGRSGCCRFCVPPP